MPENNQNEQNCSSVLTTYNICMFLFFSLLNIHFHYSYLILLYTLILLTILTTKIFSSYNLIHGQKYFYNIIIQWFKK